ncbi:MAG TPA: ArsR family transcriptional regulator [Woeseiaceae bacterium]|nr:ArsR family transcriptional regulator [Woeseiaceae bacterium]
MELTPAVEKYVLHWGEMGTRWGTNRTVAQIHALLYLSPEPLRADQICELLSVARSNVSTSIRELQSYGLARMVHVLGDRRDYFESIYDVWELFRVIIEQRKQRELNPTLTMLRECAAEMDKESDTDPVTKERIRNMLGFVELTSNWYEEIREIPTSTLTKLMKLGTGITRLVTPRRRNA